MREFIAIVSATLLLVGSIILPVATLIGLVDYMSCVAYQDNTGKTTKWDIRQGCYIQAKNKEWYTKAQYKQIIIAKELVSE